MPHSPQPVVVVSGPAVAIADEQSAWSPSMCPEFGPGKDLVSVDAYVRRGSGGCWARALAPTYPGELLYLQVRYQNSSNETQRSVSVRLSLPAGLQLAPHTTWLKNSNFPGGVRIESDALASSGLVIGATTYPVLQDMCACRLPFLSRASCRVAHPFFERLPSRSRPR